MSGAGRPQPDLIWNDPVGPAPPAISFINATSLSVGICTVRFSGSGLLTISSRKNLGGPCSSVGKVGHIISDIGWGTRRGAEVPALQALLSVAALRMRTDPLLLFLDRCKQALSKKVVVVALE